MNPSVKAAIAAIRKSTDLLEVAVADSEPAPFSIVLTRDLSSGLVHRRGRISGIPGLMTFEGDNLDQAGAFEILPDLSNISDEYELCVRCFGAIDPGEDNE